MAWQFPSQKRIFNKFLPDPDPIRSKSWSGSWTLVGHLYGFNIFKVDDIFLSSCLSFLLDRYAYHFCYYFGRLRSSLHIWLGSGLVLRPLRLEHSNVVIFFHLPISVVPEFFKMILTSMIMPITNFSTLRLSIDFSFRPQFINNNFLLLLRLSRCLLLPVKRNIINISISIKSLNTLSSILTFLSFLLLIKIIN